MFSIVSYYVSTFVLIFFIDLNFMVSSNLTAALLNINGFESPSFAFYTTTRVSTPTALPRLSDSPGLDTSTMYLLAPSRGVHGFMQRHFGYPQPRSFSSLQVNLVMDWTTLFLRNREGRTTFILIISMLVDQNQPKANPILAFR